MRSAIRFHVAWLVLAVAASGASPAQPASSGPPVVCFGNQEIRLVDHQISTADEAVVAKDNCELHIRRSRLMADGVAVRAMGNAEVYVVDSFVSGKLGSLRAEGNAVIHFSGSEIRGPMAASGLGELDNRGRNRIFDEAGARVEGGDTGRIRAGAVEIGPGGIRVGGVRVTEEGVTVGGGGVVVVDEGTGERVVVDEHGVRTGSESVRVDPETGETVIVDHTTDETVVVDAEGNVRVDSPEGTIVVAGDWREGGTVYTDTDRVLVELGAVTEGGRILVDLAGDVLFDFDSTAIRDAAAAQLSRVAHVVRRRAAGRVTVIGHTDSIGTAAYNQKLSEDRALAVMRWLNRVEGIPMEIMAGQGLGSTRPIAHNTKPDGSDDPDGRARNRRVEIQIQTGG